jgi:hypothetical protein
LNEEIVMDNQKNKMLTIILGIIAVFSLISLACFNQNGQGLVPTVPKALPASQESVNNPYLAPTVPTKPEVIIPDPEPDPDPEADPEPAPVLKAEPLVLGKVGFGQNNQEAGFAFKVKNLNPDLAIMSIPYQVAVYDANETVVNTDGGYIDFILPGQELGVGGIIYLDEGVTAAKIEVQLSEGEPVATELTEPLAVKNITYIPSDYNSSARGVITNPYDQDITSLQVSAVLYDETDQIVGGGNTYLSFILANGSSGIIIPVSSSKDVSRVEIYPTITSIYEFENPTQMPVGARNLAVIKQGFGQNNTSLGIGTTIENPNQGYAIESSMYQSTSYSNDGSVLGVSTGYINLVLPTQILGVADSQYLDEGAIISRIDVQIKTGYFTQSNIMPMFTSENVTFIPDEYSPQVTGEIVNPYSKEVSNVRVDAIAYNDAGDIVGSGYTYLNFVPANSKAAVSVYVTVAGTPAKVELFAVPSTFSDIVE